MSERLVVAAVILMATMVARADAPALGLGRPIAETDLAGPAISVAPDGAGLPAGQGTARTGRAIYDAKCAACHGMKGEGIGDYPPLVGGRESLKSDQPLYTVGSYWPYATTVWDYINRAMPYTDAGTLSVDDVYAVTAYVLYLNGIISEGKLLDRIALPRVQMPNRDGFIDDPRPDVSSHPSTPSEQAGRP
jgi:mono/diheme cytochrome c family protein